jgi:hypothetical protein
MWEKYVLLSIGYIPSHIQSAQWSRNDPSTLQSVPESVGVLHEELVWVNDLFFVGTYIKLGSHRSISSRLSCHVECVYKERMNRVIGNDELRGYLIRELRQAKEGLPAPAVNP